MKMKCFLEEMWPQNFFATEKLFVSQVSSGIMLHASKSTHSARGSFGGPLPAPLILSDLIHVVHNQRGMSSPLLPRLGDIIFSYLEKPLLIALTPPKAALLVGPQGLFAVCETTIGSRSGYTWEMFLHCIAEVTQGHIHAHWSCSVIIFPKRKIGPCPIPSSQILSPPSFFCETNTIL